MIQTIIRDLLIITESRSSLSGAKIRHRFLARVENRLYWALGKLGSAEIGIFG